MSRFCCRLPFLLCVVLSGGVVACASADKKAAGEGLREAPRRANLPSYLAAQVKRGKFEGIVFGEGVGEYPKSERSKLRAVATYLKVGGERVILAGGAKVGSAEYARQLGQQRAGAVQQALVAEGIPPNRISTVSFGLDLPGKGGDRVEFGFVPTGEQALLGRPGDKP